MEKNLLPEDKKSTPKRCADFCKPHTEKIIIFSFVIGLVIICILFVIFFPEKVHLLIILLGSFSFAVRRLLREILKK